jgi:hypothetical protein
MKNLPAQAFLDCVWIENVTLGEGVTSVGNYAFSGCTSLSDVTFSDDVTKIGALAFRGCVELEKINIGKNIKSIGSNAFYDAVNLENVYIEDLSAWCKVTLSNNYSSPFYYGANLYVDGNRVTDVVIPDSVKAINSYLFYGANIMSVTLPDVVTSIGTFPFDSCLNLKYTEYDGAQYLGSASNPYLYLVRAKNQDIESIRVHDGTEFIGRYAFIECTNLKSVSLPDTVVRIGNYAFSKCESLTEIIIPSSVKALENFVFTGCTSLERVVIGESVSSIGYHIFDECQALSKVEFLSTDGWQASINSNMSEAVAVPESILESAFASAELMKGEYIEYFWKRSAVK